MPSFLFHLQVKPECQGQALATLAAIQRAARLDEGCLSFTWFRHKSDPNRFTMHERWTSEAALTAHKAKGVDVWQAFVPCLAADPVAEELEQVGEVLCAGLTDAMVRRFAQEWFDKLSNRAPVEQLLALAADNGLDIRFPDARLRNHAEFAAWYASVGERFDEQEHVLESLATQPSEAGMLVFVTVVWKARQKSDGQRLAMRANQTWTLGRAGADNLPVVLSYNVNSLENA
ncbi:MAG: antibiotic biosynthesis monooxygenase [Pirellulales bacterium]|nr:antibiotic biosynthesis monooxygenase [Pirellulales bacterium]